MNLVDVDLRPFTRLLWDVNVDQSFKNLWNDLQRECWMAELLTVRDGVRKCATTHVGSDRMMEDMELLNDLGLRFEPLRKAKRVQGFAHKFYDDVAPNEAYDVYGVVGTTRADVLAFRRASESGNHIAMGELLGYPRCCSEFFVRVWKEGEFDPVWSAALNTEGAKQENEWNIFLPEYSPENVIILRYFGIRAVPHLVCSFKCEESKKFGQTFMEYISEKKKLLEILSSPMSWDCWRGCAIITTLWFRGITNSMNFAERRVLRLGLAK